MKIIFRRAKIIVNQTQHLNMTIVNWQIRRLKCLMLTLLMRRENEIHMDKQIINFNWTTCGMCHHFDLIKMGERCDSIELGFQFATKCFGSMFAILQNFVWWANCTKANNVCAKLVMLKIQIWRQQKRWTHNTRNSLTYKNARLNFKLMTLT